MFGGWAETSLNQFVQIVENYPVRKLELFSSKNRYIGHQGCIWQMKAIPIFFFMWSRVEALKWFDVWVNMFFFQHKISFLAKYHFLKNTCHTTIYLLDWFGFGPKCCLFIMQNYLVRKEWNKADVIDPLLYNFGPITLVSPWNLSFCLDEKSLSIITLRDIISEGGAWRGKPRVISPLYFSWLFKGQKTCQLSALNS